MDRQLDLFDLRGRVRTQQGRRPIVPDVGPVAARLSDEELVAMIPQANLSNIEALSSEVVSRSLEAAVPALEELWRRFVGFGIKQPLLEQHAVLDTLARLNGETAGTALKRIVLWTGLPGSLLPAALQAAADAGLGLPATFIATHLGHEDVAVRGPAFVLALKAGVPGHLLRDGLSDPSAHIRLSAAIAMAIRGDPEAREPLLGELAENPSTEVVEALAVICDDDVVVHLGRCAERHPAHRAAVLDILNDLGSPKARRLARHLEEETRRSGEAGAGGRLMCEDNGGSVTRSARFRHRRAGPP